MHGLYERPELYEPVAGDGSAMVDFYARVAGDKSADVLDVGCGSGRVAIPLAERGHQVTGIDLSPEMLAMAREAASDQNVALELVEADFRSFDLGDCRVDFAFSAANSLLHLRTDDDLLNSLRTVWRHLRPGGRFAFDMFVPDPAILTRDPRHRTELTCIEHPRLGTLRVDEATAYDPASQMLEAHWRWYNSGEVCVHEARFALRQRFPEELAALLELAPFQIAARYGDFDTRPFAKDSWRQVYVLEGIT